jgi:hypothetical protein
VYNADWGSGDTVFIGGLTLIHFDGTDWSNVPMTGVLPEMQTSAGSSLTEAQIGLWGTGPRDVYLGSGNGRIARSYGSSWSLMPTTGTGRIAAIASAAG